MEDLIGKVLNQNFVPVLDDQKCFIGIITRKDIIKYFYQKCELARQRSGQNAGNEASYKKTDISEAVRLRSREEMMI